jgi:hypothetical protein
MKIKQYEHYTYEKMYSKTSAGLFRIYSHIKSGSFALIGAFKGSGKTPENYRRSALLAKRIREVLPKEQSGYLPVTGHWKSDTSGEMSIEPSYFIPNISFDQAKNLAKEFEQESFIWGDKGDWFFYDTITLKSTGGAKIYNSILTKNRQKHIQNINPKVLDYLNQDNLSLMLLTIILIGKIIMAGEGYFISPHGDILEVKTFHINEVLEYPNKFGFTIEELHHIYDHYNEGYGHEGKARKEILAKVLANDWIRIRHYPRSDQYYVDCSKYNNKTKEYIQAFAEYMLPSTYLQLTEHRKDPKIKDKGNKHAEVVISSINIKPNTTYDETGEPINASKESHGTFTLLNLLQYKHMNQVAAKLNHIKSMLEYQPTNIEKASLLISKLKFILEPKL